MSEFDYLFLTSYNPDDNFKTKPWINLELKALNNDKKNSNYYFPTCFCSQLFLPICLKCSESVTRVVYFFFIIPITKWMATL